MNKQLMNILLMAMGLCLATKAAWGHDSFGWVEKVSILPWDVEVKAKLDTGALTSSLHAEDIKYFERDDEDWVRFTIDLENERDGEVVSERIERPVYRKLLLSGAGGEDRRPAVLMKVCIGGTIYEEQFSLENRDDLIYPVLLGRRTIQHMGEIDVTRTFLQDPDCDEDSNESSIEEREDDEDIGAK